MVALAEEEWLTDYTKLLISERWKPCGLDGWLLKQLFELMEEGKQFNPNEDVNAEGRYYVCTNPSCG